MLSLRKILWGFTDNPYPRPNLRWLYNCIPGREVRDTSKITREEKQYFYPRENKVSSHLLELGDFAKKITKELTKIFHEKWASTLFDKKNANEHSDRYLHSLAEMDFTRDQAKQILSYAIENIVRLMSWSHDNERVGKRASKLMSFAILFGIVRNIISDNTFVPSLTKKVISFFYAFTSSMRGFYQYSEHIYNRPDDEAAMNRYQARVYGNKVAGNLCTLACFMETKINPFILPLSGLFQDRKILDSVMALFTIPNLSWWRGRMPAHVNQEFLTDLLSFLLHKPLSLIGVKNSKEEIEGIKERGNLELSYVKNRHCENLGIKDKKDQRLLNFTFELIQQIKNSLVSTDVKVQQESAKKIGETIAPLFGFTAFIATTIGIPFRFLFKFLGKESRVLDFFTSLSLSCQQCIYLFKMVIPEFSSLRKIRLQLLDPNLDKKYENKKGRIEVLKELSKKKQKLSFLGLVTFFTSILNSSLKLLKFENPHFEKAKVAIEGLDGDLVSKFFSERRHVLGFQFKAENPEFYEEESNKHFKRENEDAKDLKGPKSETITPSPQKVPGF